MWNVCLSHCRRHRKIIEITWTKFCCAATDFTQRLTVHKQKFLWMQSNCYWLPSRCCEKCQAIDCMCIVQIRRSSPVICVTRGRNPVLRQFVVIVKISSNDPYVAPGRFIHSIYICLYLEICIYSWRQWCLNAENVCFEVNHVHTWDNFAKKLPLWLFCSFILLCT